MLIKEFPDELKDAIGVKYKAIKINNKHYSYYTFVQVKEVDDSETIAPINFQEIEEIINSWNINPKPNVYLLPDDHFLKQKIQPRINDAEPCANSGLGAFKSYQRIALLVETNLLPVQNSSGTYTGVWK